MTRSLQEIGLSIQRLQMHNHRALNTALAPLRISLVQWEALRHLEKNPGASLHDLALLTFQSDQAFGTLAGRMIDRGLIERAPGPGRAVRHQLTDKGRERRLAGGLIVDRVLSKSLANVSPKQLARFDKILGILLSSGESIQGDAIR